MTDSSDETRQRLIDAALKCFAESGYKGSSTRAIAEAAGLNEVTLFRHFGSKQKLLMAAMRSFNRAGFAENFRSQLTGDYAADIGIMARLEVEDMLERFEGLRLIFCESRSVPELHEAIMAGAGSNTGHLIVWFTEQIEAGAVRADLSPEALAETFIGLFSSNLATRGLLENSAELLRPDPARLDMAISIFVRGTQTPR